MATWKKIIVSGSSAHLLDVTASNLTQDRLVIAGPGGALQSTNLKYSASLFEFGDAKVSGSIFSGSQFSGSFFGDGTGLTGITAEWDGTHVGNASITGSFAVSGSTGTVVDFTGVDAISGSIFSGSFVGDGSGLTGVAATLGVSGSVGIGFVNLKTGSLSILGTNKQITTNASASIITVGLANDIEISGSLIVTGSLTGSSAKFDYVFVTGSVEATGFSGSFSGSFQGDGSGLTGIAATLSLSGSVGSGSVDLKNSALVITGSANGIITEVSGAQVLVRLDDHVIVNQLTATTASLTGSFTGSFVGDGSRLTGLPISTLGITGSVGSGSVDLLTEDLSILGTPKEIEVLVSGSVVTIGLPDNVEISGSLIVTGSITGSNAKFNYINVPGAVVNDLTASFAMSAETTALNSGASIQVTPATASWILRHGLNTKYPIVAIWDSETDKIIEPDEITSIDYQTIKVDFTEPRAGWANISRAGHVVSGSTLWENIIAGPSGSQVFISDSVLGITGSLEVTNGVSGSFSGSFSGDGSNLTGIATASYALTSSYSLGVDFGNIQNVPEGLISSSAQLANATIPGNLTIEGTLTAEQFYTEYVTSSVIYQSGSTKFGDTADDTHEFTGSIKVSGSVSGSFSGSFVGDGSGLTGIATTLLLSGSEGSGEVDLKAQALLITGSANGIVTSGSGASIHIRLDDHVIVNQLTSASASLSGSFTGSFFGDGSGLTGIAATLAFSGSQGIGSVDLKNSALVITGSANQIVTTASGSEILIGLADHVIVNQLTAATSSLTGSFTGSFVGDGSLLTGIATTFNFSGSEGTGTVDLKTQSLNITGSINGIKTSGSGVDLFINLADHVIVNQLTAATASLTGSFTGSFKGDGAQLTGLVSTLGLSGSVGSGSVDLQTESLTVLGTVNEVSVAVSSSTVTIGLPDNVQISGSLVVSGSVTGSQAFFDYIKVSGSVINDLTASYAMNSHTTALNSGTSVQITPATASWIIYHGLNSKYPIVEIWDSATDRVIEPSQITSINGNTIQVDFTVPVAGWANISRAGHVFSGSVQWESIIAGPSGSQVFISDGTLGITGSLEVTNGVSGSFSGSFQGDGSGLTGIAATLNFSGSQGIGAVDLKTQSLNITGSINGITTSGSGVDLFVSLADHVIVNQLTATTASLTGSFTGSFSGDGSGLTGIAASMYVSASGGGSGSIDLKTGALTVSGSVNEIEVTFNDATNTLTIGLPNDVTITNDLTVQGDLIVNGDTTVINTTQVLVEDKFIILASGSTSPTDGGIIVQSSGSAEGFGFGIDASSERWALQKGMSSPAVTITPDAYVTATQFGAEANQPQYPSYGATGSAFGNIWVSTDTGDIFIWA